MTHPNLLRLSRWCAKWAGGFLLVACLGLSTSCRPTKKTDKEAASVTVSPGAVTMPTGASRQLVASVRDAAGAVLAFPVTWTSSSPAHASVSNGLVTALAAGEAIITARSAGLSGSATVTVTPLVVVTKPEAIADLTVEVATDSSLTLTFTEVADGSGKLPRYAVRQTAGVIAWGSAEEAGGTCRAPIAGTKLGAKHRCTVTGLAPSTSYQFQAIAFRGTQDSNAVFGDLSNVANGATTESLEVDALLVLPPEVTVEVPPSGIMPQIQFCATFQFPNGAIALKTDDRPQCDSLYRRLVPLSAQQLVTPAQQARIDR